MTAPPRGHAIPERMIWNEDTRRWDFPSEQDDKEMPCTSYAPEAAVRILLDPDRQDEPDEENVLRAFEALGGRLS